MAMIVSKGSYRLASCCCCYWIVVLVFLFLLLFLSSFDVSSSTGEHRRSFSSCSILAVVTAVPVANSETTTITTKNSHTIHSKHLNIDADNDAVNNNNNNNDDAAAAAADINLHLNHGGSITSNTNNSNSNSNTIAASSSSTSSSDSQPEENEDDELSCSAHQPEQKSEPEQDVENMQQRVLIEQQQQQQQRRVPDDCRLVYARVPSNNNTNTNNDNNQQDEQEQDVWGTYTMVARKKGTSVRKHGDIVIQWTDPITTPFSSSSSSTSHSSRELEHLEQDLFLRKWTWNGAETGGHYEGYYSVESVVSGIGLTATATTTSASSLQAATTTTTTTNILPFVPRVDSGSITRFDSPGAGAITSYHNLTWWFTKNVQPGEELVYNTHKYLLHSDNTSNNTTQQEQEQIAGSTSKASHVVSLEYLKSTGYCMDNLYPRSKSRIKDAGRGVYTTRRITKHAIVAPVPVKIVHRDDLRIHTNKNNNNNDQQQQHQLLLNYCLGHTSSNWLLFPYASMINLINHYHTPNVELRVIVPSSQSVQPVLGLVALRDIQYNEELYLHYGRQWEEAWYNHTTMDWNHNRKKKAQHPQHYTPSYVMDDTVQKLRTVQEQKAHPYPTNIRTTCFYKYSDRTSNEKDEEIQKNNNNKNGGTGPTTSYKWKLTKGIYDLKHLRPCQVVKRMDDDTKHDTNRSYYAVRILNHHHQNHQYRNQNKNQNQNQNGHTLEDDEEYIPTDVFHIVTHVPRSAIRFSDKPGTTDQHLSYAFRHEIGISESILNQVLKKTSS